MRVGDTVEPIRKSGTTTEQAAAVLYDQGGSPLHFVITATQQHNGRLHLKFAETGNNLWDAIKFYVVKRANRGDALEDRFYQTKDAFNTMRVFQSEVGAWVDEAFDGCYNADGEPVVYSVNERNFRFFEEACELVQSCDMSREHAHKLVDMVWDKPVEPVVEVEVGGVLSTLAALCNVRKYDMWKCAVASLKRNWEKIDLIRSKQKNKPAMFEQPKPLSFRISPEQAKAMTLDLNVTLEPTPYFRWAIIPRTPDAARFDNESSYELQQLYTGFNGKKEWRKVPVVRVDQGG